MANKLNRAAVRAQYTTFRQGWNAYKQSLYDFQAYAAAGQTELTFFAIPVGQNSKTFSDTNMQLAGQLPLNQEFLVQSIEVIFYPNSGGTAAQLPSATAATSAAIQRVNDTNIVGRTGNLRFAVGQRDVLQEAPLGRFPPKHYFDLETSVSQTITSTEHRSGDAHWAGRPYLLAPAEITLQANVSFSVKLSWPEGVQALPSGLAGRIGVVLDGIMYSRSQ